jgi:ABC-type phosphate/phosphonate transport system permease subunit
MAFVACVEGVFHYDIFTHQTVSYSASWGELRSISTLGNPNYVAGYLLMIFPFLIAEIRTRSILPFLIVTLGIIMTGSIIGIVLALLMLIYSISERYF